MSEQNQPVEYTPDPRPDVSETPPEEMPTAAVPGEDTRHPNQDPLPPGNPPPSPELAQTAGPGVEREPARNSPPIEVPDAEPIPPEEAEVLPAPGEEPSEEPSRLEQRLAAIAALSSQNDRIEHKLDLLLELGHGIPEQTVLPQYASGIRAAEPPTHLPLASAGPSQVLPEVAFYPEGTPAEEQHDQPQVGPQAVPTSQYFPPPPVMTQTGAQA